MRKKFLAMYALVGALVASPIFTSCIDSEESASVTQVRSERAAQIKAAAEMQKAMDELNLQIKQIQLEDDKANLEKTKAEAEQAVLAAQLQILRNQAALDNYNNERLSTLASAYTNALNEVANLNAEIAKKNLNMTALQKGLVTAQNYIVEQTEEKTNKIAANNAVLEILKAYEFDKVGTVNKLKEMDQQLNTISNDKDAWTIENGVIEDYASANDDDIKLATILAANKLADAPYNVTVYKDANGYLILNEASVLTYKQSTSYTDKEEILADYKAELGTEADKEDAKAKLSSGTEVPTLYAVLAAANKQLEADKKALADAEKALADNTDASQTTTLETAVNTAKEAINGDGVSNEGSEMAVAKAKDAINQRLIDIENHTGNEDFDACIAAFSGEDYETYKAAQDAWDALDEKETELQAEKEVILETFFYQRYESNHDDDYMRNNFDYYCHSVNPYAQANDWDGYIFKESYNTNEEIARLTTENETLESQIENLAKSLSLPNEFGYIDYNNGYYTPEFWSASFTPADIETMIALAKEDIKILEAELAIAQAKADNAKAALDAYLSTEEEA